MTDVVGDGLDLGGAELSSKRDHHALAVGDDLDDQGLGWLLLIEVRAHGSCCTSGRECLAGRAAGLLENVFAVA